LRAAAAQISRSMPLQEVILRSGADGIGGLRLSRCLSEGLVALCAEPVVAPRAWSGRSNLDCPRSFAEGVGERVFALVPGRPQAARKLAAPARVGVSSHYHDAGKWGAASALPSSWGALADESKRMRMRPSGFLHGQSAYEPGP